MSGKFGRYVRRIAVPFLFASISIVVPPLHSPVAKAANATDCVAVPGHEPKVTGKAALRELSLPQLRALAQENHLTITRITEILESDSTVHLSQCGTLFYEEQRLPSSSKRAAAAPVPPPVGVDVFTLNSVPGSNITMYLQFTTYALTATNWNRHFNVANGYTLAAYDLDGDPTTFNATEQAAIYDIWRRVSDDYAPFNVNVTTQDPGLAAIDRSGPDDHTYGTRVAITNDRQFLSQCSCGGIASLGTIGISTNHEYWQPALVFTSGLGSDTKAIGEATSHESGHNFGLTHDGTKAQGSGSYFLGQGAWAPIMGTSYSQPMSQWSDGDYADANNQEDDLATIAQNAPLLPDDSNNSSSASKELSNGAPQAAQILSSTDADWYTFHSQGGAATVSVTEPYGAGNLDARLDIYNASNNLLATSNPAVPIPWLNRDVTTGKDASYSFASLPAGTYYAKVTGTGQGDPLVNGYSSYGSLGPYAITVVLGHGPLSITTNNALPTPTVGIPYKATLLTSEGSTKAITWQTVAGTMPPGLALAASGTISGTPTKAGDYSVAVQATDPRTGSTSTKTFDIGVIEDLFFKSPAASSTPPSATKYWSGTWTVAGAKGPITIQMGEGHTPPGLAHIVSANSFTLRGKAAHAGTWTFAILATERDSGHKLILPVTIRVYAPIVIAKPAHRTLLRGHAFKASLGVSGAVGTRTWTKSSGALPPGLKLSSAGLLSGTPTRRGTYTITVKVADSTRRTLTSMFTFTVR